jgi:hypothetical protein
VLLANWFPRYLFPAVFIGSVFVAAMIYELLGQFRWSALFRHVRRHLAVGKFDARTAGAIFACLVVGVATLQTVPMLYRTYRLGADTSVLRVASFLNTHTPANAIIETYDSPLFFLLDRPYHYPPDQVHVDLIRRLFLGQAVQIDYNPLSADPDYLVVNRPFLMWWTLYDPVVKNGVFRPIQNYGRYTIYERVRGDKQGSPDTAIDVDERPDSLAEGAAQLSGFLIQPHTADKVVSFFNIIVQGTEQFFVLSLLDHTAGVLGLETLLVDTGNLSRTKLCFQ